MTIINIPSDVNQKTYWRDTNWEPFFGEVEGRVTKIFAASNNEKAKKGGGGGGNWKYAWKEMRIKRSRKAKSVHIYRLESHALNDLNEQQKVVMRAPRSPILDTIVQYCLLCLSNFLSFFLSFSFFFSKQWFLWSYQFEISLLNTKTDELE